MIFFINYVFFLAIVEKPMYLFGEMKFEDIQIRMINLKVDRAWLAQQCDYSARTLGAILAPKKSINQTQKALRRIWEALDREEARQKQINTPTLQERNQLVIRPTEEEFIHWSKVSASQSKPILDWCTDTLNEAARHWAASSYNTKPEQEPMVAEDQTQYGKQKI